MSYQGELTGFNWGTVTGFTWGRGGDAATGLIV